MTVYLDIIFIENTLMNYIILLATGVICKERIKHLRLIIASIILFAGLMAGNLQIEAFKLVGLGEDDVMAKFPAMYNAFTYGAPPHAGIAPGVDRMIMLLAGEESIREIIAFPMNKNAQDIMMDAPSAVEPSQLEELHIRIAREKENNAGDN